jgi:hypothetical protein
MQLSPHTAQAWVNASVKTRGRPIGLGDNLDATTAVPATELPTVAGAAPATTVTVAPTVLLCPLRRLADGSRPPTPEGSLRPCGRGHVATPIRPITDRLSLAPSSCPRCRMSAPCEAPTPKGRQRAYRVPQVYHEWFRSRLSAGGATSACDEFGAPQLDHVPFGPSLILRPPHGGHDNSRSSAASLACSV